MIRFALAAIAAIPACHFITAGLSQRAFAVEGGPVIVPTEDAEFNAATEKARNTWR